MDIRTYKFDKPGQEAAGMEVDQKVRQYMKDNPEVTEYSKAMLAVLSDDDDLAERYIARPQEEDLRQYQDAKKVKTFSEAQASIDDQVQAIIWEKGCDYETGLRYVLNKPENHFIAKKYLSGDPANVIVEDED